MENIFFSLTFDALSRLNRYMFMRVFALYLEVVFNFICYSVHYLQTLYLYRYLYLIFLRVIVWLLTETIEKVAPY